MTRTSMRAFLQEIFAWILIGALLPAPGLAQDRTAQNQPPTNPDYVANVANFHKAFQDVHRAKARQLEGPQTVDGMAYGSDTMARAMATRDVYIAQLQGFISQLSDFGAAKPEIQTPRINDLIRFSAGIALAEEVREEALRLRAAGASNGYIPPLRFSGRALQAADQADKFDAKEAAWWRSFAAQPEDRQFALLSQHILSLYDQDPLLGVIDSGFFSSQNFAGAIRAVTGSTGNAPGAADAVRKELPKFLDLALQQSHDEINRVSGFNQYGQFVEFFKPQYVRARDFAANLWGPGEKEHFDEISDLYNKNLGAESEVKHLTLAMVVGGIAVVTVIVPPLSGLVLSSAGLPAAQVTSVVLTGEALGSGLNATTMAFQWAWDGKEYLAVANELEHGQNGATVLGQSNLTGLKEKASGAGGQLLLDTVFGVISARDFKLALDRAAAARALTVGKNVNPGVRGGGSIGPGGSKVPGASADIVLPAGARPIEETLTAAETKAVLAKIDTNALKALPRSATPGDAAFLAAKLPPQKAITVAGQTFYLSAPFEGPGGRTAIVAFQQTPQGTVIPRTFYFSNEHGVWRSATGYRPGGMRPGTTGYFGRSIQKGPSVTSGRYINEGSADVIAEMQGPLSRHAVGGDKTSFVKLSENESDRAFFKHLETTNEDGPEFAQYTRASDVQTPLPRNWQPDMTKGYLDRWTMDSGLYGKLEGFLYPSQDGNAFVVVIRDGKGSVHVGSLQDAWAGVTPFGTRWSTFDTGKIPETPMMHGGDSYIENPDYNPANFADITKNLPAPQTPGSAAGPANFGAPAASGGRAGTPGSGPNPPAMRPRSGPGDTQILTPGENPYAQGVNLNPETGAAKTQPGVTPLTPDLDPGTMQMTPVPYKEHRVRRPANPTGKSISQAGSVPQGNRILRDASNADRPTRLAQDWPGSPNGTPANSGTSTSPGNSNKAGGGAASGATSKDKPGANPVDSGLGPNEPLGSEYDRPATPGAAKPADSGLGPNEPLGSEYDRPASPGTANPAGSGLGPNDAEKNLADEEKLYDDDKSPQTPPAGAPGEPAGTPGGRNGAQPQGANDIPLPPDAKPDFTGGKIWKEERRFESWAAHLYTNPDTGKQSWIPAGGKTNPPGEPIGWWGQDPKTGQVTWHPRQFPPPPPPGKWEEDAHGEYHFVPAIQVAPNGSRQIRLRVENKCSKDESFRIQTEGLPASLVQPGPEISIAANDTKPFLLTINAFGLEQGEYDGNLVVSCTSCAATACAQIRSVFPRQFILTEAPTTGAPRQPVNAGRPQSNGMGSSAPNAPTDGATQQNPGAADSAQPAAESPL